MIIGFYARCWKHNCPLTIEDYDLSLDQLTTDMWSVDISGWSCPKGAEEIEGAGVYGQPCKDGWWLATPGPTA